MNKFEDSTFIDQLINDINQAKLSILTKINSDTEHATYKWDSQKIQILDKLIADIFKYKSVDIQMKQHIAKQKEKGL